MSSKGLAGSPTWLAAGNLIYESGNLAASGLIQSQIQGAIVSQKLLGCFDDNTNDTIRSGTSFVLVHAIHGQISQIQFATTHVLL